MAPLEDPPPQEGGRQMVLHRLKGRRGAWALAAAAVIAAAIAASIAQASPAKTTAAAPCGKPKGTLTYGISGAGITALDPTTLAFSGQLPLQTVLYNSLTEYNSDGQVVNDLATKWKASKDLKTYWFFLRR